MFLNSIPQTPNLILCTLQKAFSKKKRKKKTKKTKNKIWLQDQENVAQTHWQDDIIQEKKNIQETILLQPFIEKIYTIESSES